MESGKLDEELARMSEIANEVDPAVSFSATSRLRPRTSARGHR